MESGRHEDELRFGGRRPFLVKKRTADTDAHAPTTDERVQAQAKARPQDEAGQQEQGGRQDREPESDADWWTLAVKRIELWLRCNPLHLGLEEEAVFLLQNVLRHGKKPGCSEARKRKCWLHIRVELTGVPGGPLSKDEEVHEAGLMLAAAEAMKAEAEAKAKAQAQAEAEAKAKAKAEVEEVEAKVKAAAAAEAAAKLKIALGDLPPANQEAEEPETSKSASSRSKSSKGTAKAPVRPRPVLRRGASERRASKFRGAPAAARTAGPPGKLERRKTETDVRKALAPSHNSEPPLSSMTLMERQDFVLSRKLVKVERIRASQAEAEVAECTHKPSRFTRKNSFSNVESIVKLPHPGLSWSQSPTGRQRAAFAFGSASVPDAVSEAEEGAAPEQRDEEAAAAAAPRQRRNSLTRRKSRLQLLQDTVGASSLLEACKQALQKISEPPATKAGADSKPEDGEGASAGAGGEPVQLPAVAAPTEESSKKAYKFSENSTPAKGKVQVQDYNNFQLDSFYRKRDRGSAKPGVSLLMGRRDDDFTEQVVAVIFDRSKFSQDGASTWLHTNLDRFPVGRRL